MKILFGQRVLVIVFAGFAFSLVFVSLFFFFKNKKVDNSVSTAVNSIPVYGQQKTNSPLPVRLSIPRIGVDSAIEYVGIVDGRVGVPEGPAEVAWFNLGTHPGEVGSAVVAGHSGWKNNIPAVFDNLHELEKGDRLYIENDKGEIISFVVRETRKYDPKANPPEVFGSNDGRAHLNLVTCTGTWDNAKRSHSDRLVVFTDRE